MNCKNWYSNKSYVYICVIIHIFLHRTCHSTSFLGSQNPRIAEVGNDLWRHLVKQGYSEQGAQTHVQISSEDLQVGDCTTSLGNLCQFSVICTAQFFPVFRGILLYSNLYPSHLVLAPLRKTHLCQFCTIHAFIDTDEILLNLLFTLWTIPAVSAPPHRRGTPGPKNPRILLTFLAASTHCWFLFNLVSTRTQRPFSAFQLVVASPALLPRVAISKWRTLHFPLNFMRYLLIHLSRLTRSLNGSTVLWHVSYSSQVCVFYKLAEGTDYSIVQIIKETVERTGLSINSWVTLLITGLKIDFASLTATVNLSLTIQPVYDPPYCLHIQLKHLWVSYG